MAQGLIQTKEASGGGLPEDGPALQPTQVLTCDLIVCSMDLQIAQTGLEFIEFYVCDFFLLSFFFLA